MRYKIAIFNAVALCLNQVGIAPTNNSVAVENFNPASTNQQGKLYPQVNSEHRVRASISAPQATKV